MIDVSLIKVNGKSYSVKSSLLNRTGSVKLIVEYVYEAENVDGSSFTKLKTLYENDGTEPFNRMKFSDIFDALTRVLARKYNIHSIVI